MSVAYRCPTCRTPLRDDVDGLVCGNSHRFDRAREGYVNLLPSGRLRGRPAGDDDAMIRARRVVFDAGLYAPIVGAVAATVASLADDRDAVLDCGCGEGSYLAAATDRSGAAGWGIDISKPAIKLAARRHRAHRYAVGSSYSLPFDDAVFAVAVSVFSPRPFTEMMRVVRAGGHALTVTPGPEHLHELKALVYDDPRRHRDDATTDDQWPTEPSSTELLRFDVRLDDPLCRRSLLEMTPYWWTATDERRAAVIEQAANGDRRNADQRVSAAVSGTSRPSNVGG